MRITGVFLLSLLLLGGFTTASVFAQGTLKGRAVDTNGGVIPGVEVVASNGAVQERRVTDASGHYEFAGLPAGSYDVTASLAGFVTRKPEAIAVVDGGSATLDFELCPGGMVEIDWPLPSGLREMFRAADAVAYVRISETRPVSADCAAAGFLHKATVIEKLKDRLAQPISATLAFVQERWSREQTPYPVGEAMVVFLSARNERQFSRAFGPFGVFFIDGDTVTSWHSYAKDHGTTASEFLVRLRELGKEADRR